MICVGKEASRRLYRACYRGDEQEFVMCTSVKDHVLLVIELSNIGLYQSSTTAYLIPSQRYSYRENWQPRVEETGGDQIRYRNKVA